MMELFVFVVGLLLLPLAVGLVVVIRIFVRLSAQQRQIDSLGSRLEALATRIGRLQARDQVTEETAQTPPRQTTQTRPVQPAQTPPVYHAQTAPPPAAPSPQPRPLGATVPQMPAIERVTVPAELVASGSLPSNDLRQGYANSESRNEASHNEATRHAGESLETRIGSRWLLYVGVIAIVVGVAYFEKLAFENHWVSEAARVVQGGLGGLALVYAGIRFRRAGFTAYGQMISGCGAAILYLSTYAAFNFYHLIDRPAAFVLMIVITAGTALLADSQRAQGLAVLAVGGGFATPFMLPGTTDAQIALFGYTAVLIAGTVALSRRRDWPLLNLISYFFTVATVTWWAIQFYTSEKYLRTEIFITVFCAMFLAIVWRTPKSTTPDSAPPVATAPNSATPHSATPHSGSVGAAIATPILWTAPAVYYLASLAILAIHPTALLVWVVGLALASAILVASVGVRAGFVVWLAAVLPLLIWCATYRSRQWLAPGLIAVTTVYAIALAAQLYRESERTDFTKVDVVWLHLNGLLTFAAAYLLIDSFRHADSGPVAAGFAAWHGALAGAIWSRHRDRALHFAGVGFTLLMIAVGLQFDGAAVTIGWAAEGAVVVALGLRESRDWLRIAGAGLFVFAIGRTADLLVSPASVHHTPFFNVQSGCAAFVIALGYVLAWLYDRQEGAPQRGVHIAAALTAAQLITVMLITSEINAYWSAPEDTLTRELAKSVAWALYATLLIVIGLRGDYAPIRYFAILLFGLTTVKVFFVDTAQLERVYRILSVIGLGIALLVTSYLYQRTRRQTD